MAEPTDSGEGGQPGTSAPPPKPVLFDREAHPSGETEVASSAPAAKWRLRRPRAKDEATTTDDAQPAETAQGRERDPTGQTTSGESSQGGRTKDASGPLSAATVAALGGDRPEPEPPPADDVAAETDKDVAPAARRPRWRGRFLPKTALGLAALILAAAIGSAFSGVVLYAYYEYRLAKTDARVSNFITSESHNLAAAQSQINTARDSAIADINRELTPLKQLAAQGQTLQNLITKVSKSMFFVHTLDEAGQPSVGSAFVVASDQDQSLLLASYTTIRAATHNPRPDVFARQGSNDLKVTVWTWEPQRDLALLILPKGNLPSLPFIGASAPLQIGDRIFAVSGLGALGAAVTQGFISDVSAAGIQHNAAIAPSFQGGPLVDSDGNVMGMASRSYAPLNFPTDSVWFGVPIHDACEQVLKCPAGSGAPAPGNQQH